MPNAFSLAPSFNAIGSNLRVRRLFCEDDGVEGCGLFHRRPEQSFHILGNVLRLIFSILAAPFSLFTPRVVVEAISNYSHSTWLLEYATTPDAVLSTAKGGGCGQYDVTGFKPSWVLKATIRDGTLHAVEQVPYSEDVKRAGYTALSYPMRSAAVLADEAGFVRTPPPPGREYTLADRRAIAGYFLRLYCATPRSDAKPDRTEYIWLDEFCLSDDSLVQDTHALEAQRSVELGRLPDIFGGAAQTAVFCHEEGCDHTRLTCIWGQRLFTIPEILHAQTILQLTRRREGDVLGAYIMSTSGRDFRKAMQSDAVKNNKWHLYAIFQHTVNAGAVPWQVAIHALVVEAIRRDEAGGFLEHKFLGKALNGLLPRRARLQDLGKSGWADLAWLLELNQGFYNAVSLAAVCSVADGDSLSWLGKPIDPKAGNERLEPVVTAFPVSASNTETDSVLAIIEGETLGLRPNRLKRDAWGLYKNEEMRGLKILAISMVSLLVIISIGVVSRGSTVAGVILFWVTSILYCILELLVGTMYLERNGWVFLENEEWGNKPELKLGEQDNYLRTLTHWGEQQMVPRWEAPRSRLWSTGNLLDLRSRVCTEVTVVCRPNALVPLAVHGSGVTCMLLTRPYNSEKEPTVFAQKVGMCNVPPYIFAQTVKTGTLYIGNEKLH